MDAFYASVEQLDNPSLRGKALIVGPNSNRGVVLTASYEARKFGVKSAMPMAEARRRCPDMTVVPPRFERYQELSARIMGAFENFSPNVEAISLDEAFLDMSGAEGIFGPPSKMAQQIQQAVSDATDGLTASVGIASTKYVAKVASDFNKPNGLTVVPPEDAVVWLDPMPVRRLWGAGPKTVPRLEQLGLFTIGDVRRADPEWLRRHLGHAGPHFQSLANANDPRPVKLRRVAKSMGSDRTLLNDIVEREDIEHYLRRSADRIGRRLREKNYHCRGVRVKLKTSDFQLLSRQALLPESTDSSDRLFEVAVDLLSQFESTNRYRLVGLAAYDLIRAGEHSQLDLFTAHGKPQALERTIDEVIRRFGKDVVKRAADLGKPRTIADTTPNLDFIEPDDN
jgi:DNA polymerase-4